MFKKVIYVFCFIFLVLLKGCSNAQNNNGLPYLENEKVSIYDIHNNEIGQIERYGILIQTDDSIIYNKIPKGSTKVTKMDYYRFVFETKENIKLGTVKNWAYEAKYDTSLMNDHLYMLITTGNIFDESKRDLKLYKINLNNNKMSEIFSEKGGFPYSTMTVVRNRLLMIKVNVNGCELEEYSSETKERKTLKRFNFDMKTNTGEVIRQITSDEETISLLRLKMEGEEKVWLYVDSYDHDMNLLRSVDISTVPLNFVDSPENELRQGVASFVVKNDYVFYGNFSITKFLGKIEGNTINPIIEIDPEFGAAAETVKNEDSNLFFQSFSADNELYLLHTTKGTMKKATFKAEDERYHIINASIDTKGKVLITVGYKDPITGEELDTRLYYINLSDLEWTDVTNFS